MSRFTEFKAMIEIDKIPSDDSFLMLAPSLGLTDKKKIILIRRQAKKNNKYFNRILSLLHNYRGFKLYPGMRPDFFI
jgi:hypothetical protein